jgi:hypothetical protein
VNAILRRALAAYLDSIERDDEQARRIEKYEPKAADVRDTRALRDLAVAFARVAASERDLAVRVARAEGHTWAAIGAMLGTSGEAARQRYGIGHG